MLEDNADDAYLIQKSLQKSKLDLNTSVVSTKEEFLSALDSFRPDIILSDHQLPQFSSTDALRFSREKSRLIPFILVTGAVSEEFAAAIIRDGADDYLLKGNIKRLPTAIIQALEKRQTQESLEKSQEQQRAAELELINAHRRLLFHIENTPLGYIEWDTHLYVKSWSKRAEHIFGWSEREMIQSKMNATALLFKDDFEAISRTMEQLLSGTVDHNTSQNRYYNKDGRVIWCEWFNSVMKDEAGNVVLIMSMVQDITAQKTVESILKEYNDRYEILSRATNDAIWDWQIDYDTQIWNHGIQTIFGYREREIPSVKKWRKAKIHPTDHERVSREIKEAFATRATNWTSQYQYLCADGSYKYVLDRGYVIYHEGRPIRMIGAMQDITAQRNFIKEIEKLSLVASKTNNAVLITDSAYRIEWVNQSFVNMTGYSQNEVAGKNAGLLLRGPKSDPKTIDRIQARLNARELCVEDIISHRKDGTQYWVRLEISPVLDADNTLTNFISIQTDISAQKEYENQITNIARELSSLIENANVPIFGVDRNGNVNEWNRITTEISEYNKDDVIDKPLTTLLEGGIHEEVSTMLHEVFSGESVRNYELPFTSQSGRLLILLISISPRRDVDQNICGAICVGQDITELFHYRQGLEKMVRERTHDLNEALRKEKELVEMKSKFVSIASHEFRTPLSIISLASGVLKKHGTKLPETQYTSKLDTIDRQVSHMTYLLDDILVIGKADAGKIEKHLSPINIQQFFQGIAADIEESSKGYTVRLGITTALTSFRCDEKLLRNIVINLLTNAVKFSPVVKEVYIQISAESEALRIEVTDNGIGISDDDLVAIFTPFHRGSNVGTVQGTGLGLSIVKKAVELLDGDVKVTSKLGKGTQFTILLPV